MARPGKLADTLRLLTKATAADLWDHLAVTYEDRVFLTLEEPSSFALIGGTEISYRQMRNGVAKLARVLVDEGVEPGDRVALCAGSRVDYAMALFAIIRMGAVAVPLHHHLTLDDVKELLRLSKAKTLVCDPRVALKKRGLKVLSLAPGGGLDAESVHAAPLEPAAIDPDGTCAVLFTSGTTGTPKGAELTSKSLLAVTRLAVLTPDGANEQTVCGLPLAHIMGLSTLLSTAMAGARMHWLSKFDAATVMDALVRLRATFFVGVPAMYAMLADHDPEHRDLSSVRIWVSGADAMSPALAERFRRVGCALKSPLGRPIFTAGFAEIYGMVELSGAAILRFTPPSPVDSRVTGSVRRLAERFSAARSALAARLPGVSRSADNPRRGYTIPIPPYRIRVVDDAGVQVSAGTVGNLVVKGPGMTKGYLDDPEATKRATQDGWLLTGDLAVKSRLGQVTFVSRKKDGIKHGGYSVFPAEIEARLVHHDAVLEAVVLGGPHPTKGQVPVAVIVPEVGTTATAAEILAWCRETFAAYKAPRALVFRDRNAIPRNDNRKVLKDALLAQVIDELQEAFGAVFR